MLAHKVWTVHLEDGTYIVELEHRYISGRRAIRVDGELVVQMRRIFAVGSKHTLQLGNHSAVVAIKSNGFTFTYDLIVDGRSLTTGQIVSDPFSMPVWGWVLMAACAVIPLVSGGGAMPIALGLGGALMCGGIARDPEKSFDSRLLLCLSVTCVCWILFISLLMGVRR